MNGIWKRVVTLLAVALGLILWSSNNLCGQAPAGGQDSAKQPYTLVEYNAEQACAAEKVPATQVKCLDDFVSKYPNSALLIYVYPLYVNAYNQLKNPDKVIEYADKTVALGPDKVDAGTRYGVLYARALAYATLNPAAQAAGAAKAREACTAGLKALDEVKKPDNLTDDDFKKQKLQPTILFHFTCAKAAEAGKDFAGAVGSYKSILGLNPDDLSTNYNLGKAYMAMTPPQWMDAFWYFARAVTSKGATQAQSSQVKKYLRSQMANYQGGNVCDSLTDGELNELLQLAGSSADRPSSYTLPGATDISGIQKDMTIASVFTDLKAGGDKSKLTWLAACGLEFPEVPGKVIEVVPGDPIVLKIAFVTSDAEFEAATTPNMDVKVVGQPEAARVEKGSAVHFTGTLLAYDPEPFFLHWDKAKVKAEDIPKEKAAPKKPPVRRPAAKKPSGR
jgi:tetratricopeptide (TPR) repeat protein